jgi:ribosomal-protein-alanine N-acetyltransferase
MSWIEHFENGFRIRKFKASDFEQVLHIEREAFHDSNPYLHIKLYEMHSDGFLVAEKNGVILGYIIGVLTDDYEGRIFSLAVRREYSRRGIGTALLRRMLDIFHERGIPSARLEVRFSNRAAQSLYRKLDFIETGCILGYYRDGENAMVMRKNLISYNL